MPELPHPTPSSPEPTSELARGVADQLRRALSALGFSQERLPLADQITELEWLGRGQGSIFRPGGPWHEDLARAREAALLLLRFKSIARMVELASQAKGARAPLRRALHARLLNFVSLDGQPGDRLFELEIAAAMMAWIPNQVELGKNDVVIRQSDGPDFGIECKRPEKPSTIIKNVEKAINRQLKGRPGLVVVSLDKCIKTPWILHPPSTIEGVQVAQELIASLLQAGVREDVARALPEGTCDTTGLHETVLGVLFMSIFGLIERRRDLRGHSVRHHLVWTIVTRDGEGVAAQLLRDILAPMIVTGYERTLSDGETGQSLNSST